MDAFMDEQQVLTESIGEHAVSAIGSEHLAELNVTLDPRDSSCVIEFKLRNDSDEEQLRAIDRLLDVQLLFSEEARIQLDILGPDETGSHHAATQRQFSFA